jgi:hypothetical protein
MRFAFASYSREGEDSSLIGRGSTYEQLCSSSSHYQRHYSYLVGLETNAGS